MSARTKRRRAELQKQTAAAIAEKLDRQQRKDEVARVQKEQEEWYKERYGPYEPPPPDRRKVSSGIMAATVKHSRSKT